MKRFTTIAIGALTASAIGLSVLPLAAQDTAPAPAQTQQAAPDRGQPLLRRFSGDERRERGEHRGERRGPRGEHGMRGMGGFGGPMRGEFIAAFDTDGDGKLSEAELTAGMAALVTKYDANNDGSLSLAEFEDLFAELTRPMTVRAFQRLDSDGDGQISAAEQARAMQMMGRHLPGTADQPDSDDGEDGEDSND